MRLSARRVPPLVPRHFFTVFSSPSLGPPEVEAALGRMLDRCVRGSDKASPEDLASLLGLRDTRTAAAICGLYAKVDATPGEPALQALSHPPPPPLPPG